ncbi:phage distal tail protein [Paenibacillus terrigena]|uniref:phage distal tail protein n=1 Tax=Paenibacillus terrigena TaxID=369333 RepID=UPI00037852C6|nr:phage tail domain-containing protein [Paenibacillus terrigena]
MFNLSPFNLSPYNRPSYVQIYFNVTVGSATDASSRLSIDMPAYVTIDSKSDFFANYTREISLAPGVFGTATQLLTAFVLERLAGVSVDSSTEFDVKITHSHVDTISFTGDFKPGDRLVIDTKKMTVTLNGQNAMHLVDGDFFSLVLGTNLITYSDGEMARDILTRITHRDKFLY